MPTPMACYCPLLCPTLGMMRGADGEGLMQWSNRPGSPLGDRCRRLYRQWVARVRHRRDGGREQQTRQSDRCRQCGTAVLCCHASWGGGMAHAATPGQFARSRRLAQAQAHLHAHEVEGGRESACAANGRIRSARDAARVDIRTYESSEALPWRSAALQLHESLVAAAAGPERGGE